MPSSTTTAAPTFANTLGALDASGQLLSEVNSVFGALQGADTNPAIQAIAKEISPLTAAHSDNIRLNEKLFARVKAVYDQRAKLKLTPEEQFLLENTYRDFVRGGALLDAKQKARLRELNQQLAMLSLKFGDNLLAETNDFKLVLENRDDLAGLPPSVVAMAEETARQLKMPGKWVFTVQVPSMTPFLQYSTRRDLREKIYRGYIMRGDRGNERDNKDIIRQIVNLRSEKAKLLGYASHAAFVVEINMAKTPDGRGCFPQETVGPRRWRAPRAKWPTCRPSSTAKAASSSWRPGTGGITPRRCARRNTPSMMPPCAPISSSRMSARAFSPCATSSTD